MSARKASNIPASIAARVRNWAAANARTFQHALNRYVTERFFARLEASEFAERLVLKGGNLLVVWFSGKDYRPTMDTDFLCRGGSLDENEIGSAFKNICRTRFPEDGILFDETSIEVEPIREDTKYGGQRVTLKAYIGNIRVPLQFDIGFGDAVTPSPEKGRRLWRVRVHRPGWKGRPSYGSMSYELDWFERGRATSEGGKGR